MHRQPLRISLRHRMRARHGLPAVVVTLMLATALSGCSWFRSFPGQGHYFGVAGKPIEGTEIAALRALAEDLARSPDDRSAAVVQLFTDYVHPPLSSAELHAVLGQARWLAEARVEEVDRRTLVLNRDSKSGEQVFAIHLFPGRGQGEPHAILTFRGVSHLVASDIMGMMQGDVRAPNGTLVDGAVVSGKGEAIALRAGARR
jgi:hypothetical protein